MILHAGLMAFLHRERWRGVLITGPSGSGKSDLALRLSELGFVMVADDRTLVWLSGGRLYGRPPQPLEGLIEARGVGVLPTSFRPFGGVDLVVDVDPAAPVERVPEPETRTLLDLEVPLLRLRALEASAPAKIRRWLLELG